MAGKNGVEPGGVGTGDDDPVSTARVWLARNGVSLPEQETPLRPRSRRELEVESWGQGQLADGLPAAGLEVGHAEGAEDVDADPESVARAIVLRKLAAQARTRHELAKALASRKVPEEVASAVLDRFEAVGLVDDASFARDWVASRQQRRHLSASALRRELSAKGVERELVDAAVDQVDSSDEASAAEALVEKKLRSVAGLPREVQYRRLAGALARRGFSGGVTAAVLGSLFDSRGPLR